MLSAMGNAKRFRMTVTDKLSCGNLLNSSMSRLGVTSVEANYGVLSRAWQKCRLAWVHSECRWNRAHL